MKYLDGVKMSDEFYKYAVYKTNVKESLDLVVEFNQANELVAVEHPISTQEELKMQIYYLTQKLDKTDYIANKLAEAITEYIITEDKTKLIELRTEYSKELVAREAWRKEINVLETQLKQLTNQV